MSDIYQAILKGNTIRWIDIPASEIRENEEIPVYITFQKIRKEEINGRSMAVALSKLAEINCTLSKIDDPIAWQKENRRDREILK